jgi:hydrogenase maturation protein HypF
VPPRPPPPPPPPRPPPPPPPPPAAMALGYLLGGERLGGAAIPSELVETFTERLPEREVDTVRRMVRAGISMPATSSAGSLVDAVASLLRLRDDVGYDGEAAVVLEGATRGRVEAELPWRIVTADGVRVYDPTPTLAALLAGIAEGAPVSAMAAGFHATLATVTLALCLDAARDSGLSTVCLSGDVFANRLLTTTVVEALRSEGFEVYVNELVPTGDGGVSFGQAAVAAARSAAQ